MCRYQHSVSGLPNSSGSVSTPIPVFLEHPNMQRLHSPPHYVEVHMPFDLVMTGHFPDIWNSSPLSLVHHLHSE
ncbi:hypothetical protein DTO013E5_3618 [Penicillium roqueforti]|uniref:uncharacterized protein n=1 Tax=Penicillium roqueforti TaxID=5082 RepID=UPI00190A609C|nr:uncharacterized protein LCP9604111_430 [Penicillium roqueforti]KAF9252904.1 hypothetical protein LCP9604111_430 [Penicillium roqueforti]KAI1832789.1 hypothetical protein CBS147337_6200 [Penicillium roqueforti]KAI2697844.1 hypothetical protein CBS147372_7416 [Penicillium roqueforti]KAI2721169.1 hypothetical protein CBS147354_5851 [Penicillium roqueforti]KAI2724083.1 hypothetical protein CBS147318_1014 [Penicillium roqueforti]